MDMKMDSGGLPVDEAEMKRRAQCIADRECEKRAEARAKFRERLAGELRRLFFYLLVIALAVFVYLHWTQIRSFVTQNADRLNGRLKTHIVPPVIYTTNYVQQVEDAGSGK